MKRPMKNLTCSLRWRRYPESMKTLSIRVGITWLAIAALGCAGKGGEPPEARPATAPVEAEAQVPTEVRPPPGTDGANTQAGQPLTQEEINALMGDSAGAPPPPPTDHRLHLGIDGDPGYTQRELTPEELAESRAEGANQPQPTYAVPPSEPSKGEQPSEPSGVADEEASDTIYGDERLAPVYRHRAREDVREDVREDERADERREVRPEVEHREPERVNRGGRR